MGRSGLTLGTIGMLALFAGCVKQAPGGNGAPDNAAREAGVSGDADWDNWLRDRPMNTAMRRMWVDCGAIIESTRGQDRVTLLNAGGDLARGAERFAAHFRAVRDGNQEAARAAAEGDWQRAGKQLAGAQQGCDGCHFEFWPLGAHGITSTVLEGWQEGRGTPRAGQVFEAPVKVRMSMGAMRDAMTTAGRAVEERNSERLGDASERIGKFSGKNLNYWESIAREAAAIEEIAQTGQLGEVGRHYTAIRAICVECHETTTEGRGLNPPPWPLD